MRRTAVSAELHDLQLSSSQTEVERVFIQGGLSLRGDTNLVWLAMST